jgi:hypothetical protein
MKAVDFPEVNVKIAEHQEDYETLPVFSNPEEGSIVSCFKLSKEELKIVKRDGVVYLKQLTFNRPMQPISLSVIKSELIPPVNSKP